MSTFAYTTVKGSRYEIAGDSLAQYQGLNQKIMTVTKTGVTRLSEEDIRRRAVDYKGRLEDFFKGIAAPRGNDSEIGGRLVALVQVGKQRGILYTSPIKTVSSSGADEIELEPVDSKR